VRNDEGDTVGSSVAGCSPEEPGNAHRPRQAPPPPPPPPSAKRIRKTKAQLADEGGYLIRSHRFRIDKTRLHPTVREYLDRAFGVYRYIYNATVKNEKASIDITRKHRNEVRAKLTNKLTNKSNNELYKDFYDDLPSLGRQKAVEHYFEAKHAGASVPPGSRVRVCGSV